MGKSLAILVSEIEHSPIADKDVAIQKLFEEVSKINPIVRNMRVTPLAQEARELGNLFYHKPYAPESISPKMRQRILYFEQCVGASDWHEAHWVIARDTFDGIEKGLLVSSPLLAFATILHKPWKSDADRRGFLGYLGTLAAGPVMFLGSTGAASQFGIAQYVPMQDKEFNAQYLDRVYARVFNSRVV